MSFAKTLKKLAQLLHEALPAKQRIYFIYTHKNGFDRFNNGLKANTEISYWIYSAISEAFPRVRFLRLEGEKPSRIEKIRENDIVIGHIGETFQRASTKTRRLITFHPWAGHEDRSFRNAFNCVPQQEEIAFFEKAAAVILLTSEYNKKEYFEKPRNFWFNYFKELQQKKPVRLVHQPIDLALFKRIKWEYETNDFLYIGNDAHMKGVPEAKELVKTVGRTLFLYGLEGKKMNHLDSVAVNNLAKQSDFFIQPGMWEAQCVSILESAARGFIPLVTPETGYPYDHPFLLRFGDYSYNLKRLQEILHTSSQEKKMLGDALYQRLAEDVHHNHWELLTNVIIEEVKKLINK